MVHIKLETDQEVTAEMIEAGVAELSRHRVSEFDPLEMAEAVKAVYSSMRSFRRKRNRIAT